MFEIVNIVFDCKGVPPQTNAKWLNDDIKLFEKKSKYFIVKRSPRLAIIENPRNNLRRVWVFAVSIPIAEI